MKKLMLTINDFEYVDTFLCSNSVNILAVGLESVSFSLSGYLTLEQLKNLSENKVEHNKELAVLLNGFYHQNQLYVLEKTIEKLMELNIDYLFFHDFAVLQISKQLGFSSKLIYYPSTLNTHYKLCETFKKFKISGFYISKEIPLIEQAAISDNCDLITCMQIHGRSLIFQSKRNLITNFNDANDTVNNNNIIHLNENISKLDIVVYEEELGTSIYSKPVICGVVEIAKMKNSNIEIFHIDTFMMSLVEQVEVSELYRDVLDNEYKDKELVEIESNFTSKFNHDYFYKSYFYDQTVYTVEDARKKDGNENKYFKSR